MRITPTYFGGGIKNMLINGKQIFHIIKACAKTERIPYLYSFHKYATSFFYPSANSGI
jgi:hypothetical protein